MINFDQVPDKVSQFDLIPEGVQEITLAKVAIQPANSGGRNLVVNISHLGSSATGMEFINFENASGEMVQYGMSRIKKLLTAVGTLPETSVSMDIVPTLLAGGKLVADFKHTTNAAGRTFSNIGDWDKVEPLVATAPVQAETTPQPEVNAEVQNVVMDDEIDI